MPNGTGGFKGHSGLQAPDEVTNMVGSVDDTATTLTFSPPTREGGAPITGYRVVDATDTLGSSITEPSVTFTGLTNGTEYSFRVWAINPFGYSSPADMLVTPMPAAWAFWAGGRTSASFTTDTIQRVNINNKGNTIDYGDLTTARKESAGLASSTRGIFVGGQGDGFMPMDSNYITMSTEGNAVLFGGIGVVFDYAAGLSNSTRGIIGGGDPGTPHDVIHYLTIASLGDTADYGDLFEASAQLSAAASTTRGLFFGGNNGTGVNLDDIQQVTIASLGNAVNFGLLTQNLAFTGSCSNSTRSLTSGGVDYQSTTGIIIKQIQFNTIASAGNAANFGDLTTGARSKLGNASPTRAIFGGMSATIESVEFASLGNAVDFGDMLGTLDGTQPPGPCSSAHGGL